MDEVEIEYLAENDHERSLLTVLSLSVGKEGAKALLPFSMLAQAVYAGESSDDPSFASNLAKMARNALLDEQYIDAFRYSFLLIEALYGGGKFKTAQLKQFLEWAEGELHGCTLLSAVGTDDRTSSEIFRSEYFQHIGGRGDAPTR